MSEPTIGDFETPKRRWQFHLSTAISGLVATGGLIGANLRRYEAKAFFSNGEPRGKCIGQGWPFNFRQDVFGNSIVFDPAPIPIIADVVTGMTLIAIVWILAQWLIRRREARKP